jgi:hypothetical protein
VGVHIRREIELNKNYVFREEHELQAFRNTADNDSLYDNSLGHAEIESGSSFEILEYIYLRGVALR